MSLPARLLDSIASAAVARRARRRRLHPPAHPDRHAAGRPGRPRRRPHRLRGARPTTRCWPQVAGRLGPRIVASDRELAATRDALVGLLRGRRTSGSTCPSTSSLVRSDFRRDALETLRAEVGPGDVVTYGGLAARVGHPRAARAVGTACATNPVPIVVPCHRVLPGSGGVGQLRAAGPELKRRLLAHEGCAVAPRLSGRALQRLGDRTRHDDRLERLLVRADRGDADEVDDVLALGDLAEQRVLRRQLRRPRR